MKSLAWALAVFLAGASPASAEPVKVVASFSILDNLVRQIGGEYVQVTSLVGPNGDAHTYQPSPSDARHLAKAQLVVVNGLGFEGWLERLIKASGYSGKIVQASDEIPVVLDGEDTEESHGDHHHGAHDPHAWQNLANGKAYVENIARALAQIDAPHAQFYLKRSEEMAQDLEFLDKWVREQIALVPVAKRSVITSHDAFGYFANAYGVQFTAPVGVSTEAEPSAKELVRLIQQIRNGGTRALFLENMSDPKIMQQLVNETGAALGGKLYADSLSDMKGPASTYQQMFRHNVTLLVKAMQGNR
ncbi:MAG: zinc ABC transporter substrate-binding protein [Alphaproteobacteria bacterium]|nr:MAG: zinc ABC transporter substrate-binding protein [Alphaproteobacteria bacterium]